MRGEIYPRCMNKFHLFRLYERMRMKNGSVYINERVWKFVQVIWANETNFFQGIWSIENEHLFRVIWTNENENLFQGYMDEGEWILVHRVYGRIKMNTCSRVIWTNENKKLFRVYKRMRISTCSQVHERLQIECLSRGIWMNKYFFRCIWKKENEYLFSGIWTVQNEYFSEYMNKWEWILVQGICTN